MKDLETIIRKLVNAKAEQDNQIDLHSYENGMRALAEQLRIADVVGQSEQLCGCGVPLIRTSDKGGEYCGICEKDLE